MLKDSAIELAAAIREGRTTSRAVVEAHITQMERVNPRLNAVVQTRHDEARAEASYADERLAEAREKKQMEKLPPLLGVPCTIKESFALEGMPQTAGLVSRRDIVVEQDAPAVARLLEAGAIPLGVTNTSELCMWMESYNEVYGRSNNPYDPERTVGGSSGGEGAIIGAGASPFGLGSDVGGSIRMPCFFNGVFGHKGSPGLVPNVGQVPSPTAEGQINRFLSTGPMCRRAEDLEPLLRILAGPEAQRLGSANAVDISRLRVFTLGPDRGPRAQREMLAAQARAADALKKAGARVATLDLPLVDKGFDIWSAMLANTGEMNFGELMFGTRGARKPLAELGRLALGRSGHTLPLVLLSLLENLSTLAPGRMRKYVAQGATLKRQIEDALGDDGVLVTLPYTEVAPPHGKPLFPPFNWVRCGLFNAMEVPSTSVPLGLNAQGLPLGVQVVAAQGQDHLGIACALELEKRFGGWVPPWVAPGQAVSV